MHDGNIIIFVDGNDKEGWHLQIMHCPDCLREYIQRRIDGVVYQTKKEAFDAGGKAMDDARRDKIIAEVDAIASEENSPELKFIVRQFLGGKD